MSYIGNTPTQQNFVAGADQFSGNGSTVAFTLSRSVNTVFDIFVTVANVPQDPFTAYTVSGNTLTFDGAPPSGTNNIDVVYRATNVQTFVPSPGVSQQFSIGTAAAPGITFIGDTNTGIYSPGADQVAIATGGVQRVMTDSGGSWLVNATAPKNPDGYSTTNFKFVTVQATTGAVDRGAILELVGTGGGSPNYWLGAVRFFSTGNTQDHATIYSFTDNGNNTGALIFATNSNAASGSSTERGRFNSLGALVLAGGNKTASGVGITFPATQSASTDANTLDDYEEGTWTPTLFKGSSQVTSPTSASGNYVKVGRLVFLTAYFYKSSGSNSTAGNWSLQNLPFTLTSTVSNAAVIGYNSVNGVLSTQAGWWQANADTRLDLYGQYTSTNWTTGGIEFSMSGCFLTAS